MCVTSSDMADSVTLQGLSSLATASLSRAAPRSQIDWSPAPCSLEAGFAFESNIVGDTGHSPAVRNL
jgi:hypothetical protein